MAAGERIRGLFGCNRLCGHCHRYASCSRQIHLRSSVFHFLSGCLRFHVRGRRLHRLVRCPPVNIVGWYFLVPPSTFTFLVQGEPITLLSFVAVGVVCVVLIASLQAAAITIADHRAHLATLEERLKAAEELHKWQEIFQNIAVGVCVTDPGNDTIGLANPAYAAIHEVPREDVLGKSLFEFYDPREWQRVRGLIANSDCTGHSSYETDCRNKSGSVFHARVHNTSVRGSDGELRYRITTTQDITKERELEERLRQAQRLEAVGQLTAGVAHDFRNVLHGVVGCLHLVQGDPHVSEEMMQAIVDALQFTEAGTKLTDQLLSFARKQELAPQRIELPSLLKRVLHHSVPHAGIAH